MENPTVVKEITFTPGNRDRIFVGWEGALLRTVNSGQTWQTLIGSEENKFFFGICTDDENPDLIFAGGWIKTPEPQPLILLIGRTGGDSWEEFEFTGETYGGILDMQTQHEEGKDVLYLGLDKGGVYEVTSAVSESRGHYSVLKLFAGSAMAARNACVLIVMNAITKAINAASTKSKISFPKTSNQNIGEFTSYSSRKRNSTSRPNYPGFP